jgi:hypothetical protein
MQQPPPFGFNAQQQQQQQQPFAAPFGAQQSQQQQIAAPGGFGQPGPGLGAQGLGGGGAPPGDQGGFSMGLVPQQDQQSGRRKLKARRKGP